MDGTPKFRAAPDAARGFLGAMELRKDDRVKLATKPDWGLGQLVYDPTAGKVNVWFREAGEKVLSLKHAVLVPVEGEEAHDPWLDNLTFAVASHAPPYVGPREAVGEFLERYPGGFRDARYLEEERQVRLSAHELVRELLDREVVGPLLEEGLHDEVCSRAQRAMAKSPLVFPNDKNALTKALKDEDHRPLFAQTLVDLLYGANGPEARFKRFADAITRMKAGRWTIATYYPFVRFPDEHMLLKPPLTQQAAARCRFDLQYRADVNRITYARLLTFASVLQGVLVELEPADMFDVQAFIGCLAQRKS